ncbi:MAG: DUF4446 family protein [Candidatus Krumholzibacteria bacterium]|nr:DUF4446 family protein [Candidatus Krumholzibacteria bacterium]
MSLWQQISVHLAEYVSQYLAVALVLSMVCTAVAGFLLLRIRAITRPYSRIKTQSEDPSELLSAVLHTIDRTESNITLLEDRLSSHLDESKTFIRHVGLVRYDAFDDIRGMQSFSLCILDAEKNGVLLTYLAGKHSTRSYAVTIDDGEAFRKLSEEESRAMSEALTREVVTQS